MGPDTYSRLGPLLAADYCYKHHRKLHLLYDCFLANSGPLAAHPGDEYLINLFIDFNECPVLKTNGLITLVGSTFWV